VRTPCPGVSLSRVLITRRTALKAAVAAGIGAVAGQDPVLAAQAPIDPGLERRIRSVIEDYGDQGFHRTATDVDRRSGDWLFDSVLRVGLKPTRETFVVDRVDLADCHLVVGGRRVDGVPLFDGGFTGPDGVSGRFGPVGTDSEIGLVTAPPNTAAAGALGEARRQNRHKALVCVTRGARPGLCLNNADSFLRPFGPPVLQVSSVESSVLEQQAANGAGAQLFATARRTRSESFNVTTMLSGSAPELEPLVIMTPRRGWYACASERGGGIACWLELMRAFRQVRPLRDILFVASSGHELGHLGINVFAERRPGLVPRAVGWMHLGANIGAATRSYQPPASALNDPLQRGAVIAMGSGATIQASDDEGEAVVSRALSSAGLTVGRRVPRGTVPAGEAEVVHRGGGRYVSIIGTNGLFHHPDDRGLHTVDLTTIASFVAAFTNVARTWNAS